MALTLSNGLLTELKTTTQTTNLQFGDLVGKINVESSAGGGNTGGPGWYFYSDEGELNAAPPFENGNAIFLVGGVGGDETFDPNQGGTGILLHFNVSNSVGANFTGDFNGASEPGGIVTITQGSNVAEYFNPNGNGMSVINFGGSNVFIIDTANCIQTQTAASPFNFNDVITLSFNVGG